MAPTNPRSKADVDAVHTGGASAHDARKARRAFVLRRLHSLSGVVPVGTFLVVHLWTNAAALAGRPAFDAAVAGIQHLPFLPAIEALGIFLPLAFHAGYGVKLALAGRPNVVAYPYARNWAYTLQRVTGVIALLFILIHLQELRIAKLLGHVRADAFYPTLAMHLSSTQGGVPWLAIVYLLGIGAAVFHFANGMSTFVMAWGVSGSRASQRRFGIAFALMGALLFAVGASTTLHFAIGAPTFPGATPHTSDGSLQSAVVDPAGQRPAPPVARSRAPMGP